MGGTKRKIEIKRIENKNMRSVAFTKRRNGLFRKASELCLLSPGTQIAILATPLSSNSHASFYSFGHSSVDHVVSSLLHNQPPLPTNQENNRSGLGFWWEDQAFDRLENVDELKEAIDAVSRMLNNVRLRLDDAVKNTQRDRGLEINQAGKEVLHLSNEDTNEITKFEGETSASASLLKNMEDNLHIDNCFY
ncbi:Transcription factor MADS-box [Arabidopsis suecica]|uniref:Transcription factor MADS-box n=1 Tax=Arabidopsis suecica TaxID=45249 RepID=A0A8T2BT30_ARASU|nr:Transcription factor MADS-box [Arabidopsis suecica]